MSAPGLRDGRLADCPRSPNCVCSEASDPGHRIAPLALAVSPEEAWRDLVEVLEGWPGARIVRRDAAYLHAECRTRLLRFVDDVEFQLLPEAGLVAVRSASRLGWSDLGANRARVEAIRARLRERGTVR